MQIRTNVPGSFAEDLRDLFEKHRIDRASGWDDGNLYLNKGTEEFWVEFAEEDL